MENAIWNGKTLVACEVAENYEEEKEVRKASYSGELWIRCEFCGEVSEFVSFGGRGRVNLGRCQGCKEN